MTYDPYKPLSVAEQDEEDRLMLEAEAFESEAALCVAEEEARREADAKDREP